MKLWTVHIGGTSGSIRQATDADVARAFADVVKWDDADFARDVEDFGPQRAAELLASRLDKEPHGR